MIKSIVGKVVLGLMFVVSSTILFSQDSKVKYPDISGIWSVSGSKLSMNFFQNNDKVYGTVVGYGNNSIYLYGNFIDDKTIILDNIMRTENGCISKSKNKLTFINTNSILNEGEHLESKCGTVTGKLPSNVLTLVYRVKFNKLLLNTLGQTIEVLREDYTDIGTYQLQLNVSTLSSGMYSVRMRSGSINEVVPVCVVR